MTDLREDRDVRGIVLNARDVTERNRIEAERERLLEQELRGERAATRARRSQGRLRRARLARGAHAADVDPRLPRAASEQRADGRAADVHDDHRPQLGAPAPPHQRPAVHRADRRRPAHGRARRHRSRRDHRARRSTAAAPTALAGGVELSRRRERCRSRSRATTAASRSCSTTSSRTRSSSRPAGGTRRGRLRARRRDGVWLEVRDTGIGINEADQEQLFNKFFRTHAATEGIDPGHGSRARDQQGDRAGARRVDRGRERRGRRHDVPGRAAWCQTPRSGA